jgi:hypothetical protein
MSPRSWSAVLAFAAVLPLSATAFVGAWGATQEDSSSQSSNAVKAGLEAADAHARAHLEAVAADPEAKGRVMIAKQRSVREHAAAAEEEAAAAQASGGASAQHRNEGIFENGEAPAPGEEFLGRNCWVGTVASHHLRIFAGQAGIGSPDGAVMVLTETDDGSFGGIRSHQLPGAGPLRVTKVRGSLVTLTGEDGRTHVLDLTSGSFTS